MRSLIKLFLLVTVTHILGCHTYHEVKRYRSESTSAFLSGSELTFFQYARYDHPNMLDEEWSRSLSVTIKDTALLKPGTIIQLDNDSLVSLNYTFFSVWVWDAPLHEISGWVKILKWNGTRLVLDQNIRVDRLGGGKEAQWTQKRRIKVTPKENEE